MKRIYGFIAGTRLSSLSFLRVAIFIVMVWIGGLKVFQYEADGIVPFVANSPLMSYFYNHPEEYATHKNREGELVPANVTWNELNGTYRVSHILGAVIVVIGLLVLAGIWFPAIGVWSGLLTMGMSLVTLSFLITTPEAFVPELGGPDHGFPFLSAVGRLVIKDVIMLAGGWIIAADSAKKMLLWST